jgi:hypothetical protein
MHENANEPDQRLVIPETETGVYYVMAYGLSAGPNANGYVLTARYLDFTLTRTEPKQGGNVGEVTVRFEGVLFDFRTQVELVRGEQVIRPVWMQLRDRSHLVATFDLRGATPGKYGLRAHSEERELFVDDQTGERRIRLRVHGDHMLPEVFEVRAPVQQPVLSHHDREKPVAQSRRDDMFVEPTHAPTDGRTPGLRRDGRSR